MKGTFFYMNYYRVIKYHFSRESINDSGRQGEKYSRFYRENNSNKYCKQKRKGNKIIQSADMGNIKGTLKIKKKICSHCK